MNKLKIVAILFLALFNFYELFAQIPISVPFNEGFVARQKTNLNSVDAYKIYSNADLNIRKSFFVQYVSSGNIFVAQGNDIIGFCRLEFLNGKVIEIPGIINWQEKDGNTTLLLGFIPTNSTRINLKDYNGSTNDYFIDGGTAQTNIANNIYTANIGLKYNNRTLTLTDGANLSGSADQPDINTLNAYLAAVRLLDPSGPVTVNALTTADQTPTLTGTVTLNSGEVLSVIVNGVSYTVAGGNLTVSGNTWTLNIPTTTPVGTYEVTAVITNSGGYILTDATTNELIILQPILTASGTLKTFSTCSGCAVAPQSFTVSGTNLSTNNIVITAPTGVQVSTIANSGFATSIIIAPTSGTVTTTTVYAKLTNNATSVTSGVISVTSTGAAAKTITVTTNTDNALSFDGSSDYASLPSAFASAYNNSAVTIEAWIKTTDAKAINEIIGWGSSTVNNNVVEFRTSYGKLQFILNDGTKFYGLECTTPVNTGKWVHVAVVKSGSSAVLYVNGQVASVTANGDITSTPTLDRSNIGLLAYKTSSTSYGPIAGSFFNGGIDQLRVWNTARTSSDIAANMFVEMSGNETGLVASYDFNQGVANGTNSITTVNDNSSNAYNGTLTTFALTGTSSNFVAGFIPSISAPGNVTLVSVGNTLQLSNGLIGGVWSSGTTSRATVSSSGLVTGVSSGSVRIQYAICDKVVYYDLNVVTPTITATGTLKQFTTCSGCSVAPQSFNVAGTNLGSNIVITSPAGFEIATSDVGTYSSTISLTPISGTVATTSIYTRLINNASSAVGGDFNITSTGATTRNVTATVNTDNALMLDGFDDHVDLGDVLDISSLPYTKEAWVYWKGSSNAYSEIITKDVVQAFAITNSNKLHANFGNGSTWGSGLNSTTSIPLNKWTHVAVTRDANGVVKLYINGILDASTATLSFNGSTSGVTLIGSKRWSNNTNYENFFNGAIDNIKVWNVEKTASEIVNNMYVELSGNEPSLLAYYNFNQGVSAGSNSGVSILYDQSLSGNNGTLLNIAKSGTTSNFISGPIQDITAAGNATTVLAGGTLALYNGLTGGVWSSSNNNVATINASTGLITGVAGGNATFSYTICGKVVTYNVTVLVPTLTTGTLKTFTSCSGCTIPAQNFTVSGTNLGSNVIITAPTGFEVSNALAGTYSTTLSLTPTSGTLATTNVYARLINNATTASNGNFTVGSTGAASKTVAATVNTDNALNFDGTSSINIGQPLNSGSSYTLEAWIKYDGTTGTSHNIISSNQNPFFISGDLLRAGVNGAYSIVVNPTPLEKNKWYHVAVSFDDAANTMKLYVNGVEVNSATTSLSYTLASGEPVFIGSHSSASPGFTPSSIFKGNIDEVRIWNTVRSASDIQNNMFKELKGASEANLKAYYTFNQGIAGGNNISIASLTDNSTTAINRSFSGFTLTGATSNFVTGFIPEIVGASILNKGLTTTYTDGLTGGAWSSSNTNIATVNSATGLVTGVNPGTSTITYTICEKTVSKLVTVVVPAITKTGTLTSFNTCLGTASAAQTFTVSAQYLTSDLVLTAPTGYELATSAGGTYSTTLSIVPSSGTVSARSIYVRLSTASVNGQSGNVSITSTGVATQNIATGNASVTRTVAAAVTISSNAINNSICAATNVVFTATPTNGGNAPTYQWKLNGNSITGANSATYSTTALTNNDVVTVLMGSSLTSCVTATPATSNSITTTVTSIPLTPGNITGQSVICMNSNQVYSVVAVPGATSYTWVVSGDLTATTSATNVLNITAANNAGSGTIKVLANNVCGSSVYSNVFSVTVSNQPAPTANFTVSANTLCLTNAGVTFTSTSTPNATTNSPIGTYSWTFGDGATASTSTTSNTYTSSGSFDAILTIEDGNQCTSSFSSRITVDPISVAGTGTAAASTICVGSSTVLTLTGNTGTIQWQQSTDGINFTNINGATSASYNTGSLSNTTYYQAVVTSGACSTATSGVVTVTVSPTPAVTLGQVANVYTSATSFDLTYNNALGTPDEYSISSVAPNALPNFTTINNFGLIGSPITVAIPASVTGTYNFNMTVKNGALGCTSTVIPFTVTVVTDPPANLSYNTPNVYNVGNTITPLNPTSTGGPITQYTIGPSLPAGLTIDPTTGIISGSPSAVSTQTSYTVTGTNASGTVTATVVITVNVAPPVSLSYNTPNVYRVGTTIIALNPTSTGGPITQYTIGPSLPAGLTIDPTTGIISGTPTATSPQTTYIVTGTNASGTVTSTVVITVNSSVVPQPQGALDAVDYGLLASDTVKLKLTTSNGTAPFTLILSNSVNTNKDTISNLMPTNNVVEFLQKRLDTTKVFTIFKLTDANNNARTSGFTKDTTIVRVLKPQILLTLKADPAVKQADNSFKTRLLLKIKNAGQLNLRNVQVNANLSTVFPTGITYVLDSVRVLSGGLVLNPNYSGAGSATSASSTEWLSNASSNGSTKSLAVLDGNYLFNSGVNLNQSEEGEVAYYVSIGATTQNVVLKLQFETAGDGVLVKNDGSSSAQQTTSISDDGTNIAQHPDITNDGFTLPTYVPLFPNEKIGASLNVGSATPVTGGYQFHFTAKVKNYGNVNLDSIRIQYNLNEIFPAPDQAVLVSNPTLTRGNLVYNVNNYNGYSNVNLFDYGGDLQVGDSATYEYDLKVTTARTAYTWQNYFVAYGRSVNSGQFISDTSMAGVDPDPNKDNDPIEKFYTGATINYDKPAPPTVENKTYTFGESKPATIGGLVKSTPTGTIPVWCDMKTAACSVTPPPTPTEIGKHIYALRSYDTTTLLYSEVLVYDTVIIKPPVPVVVNKKYIIGTSTNPNNIAGQVTGMTGSTLNYFKNAGLLSSIPTLGVVPGITRYTTSQTVNGIESDTVGFTVTMLDPKTMLHLQKIAEEPKLQTNSTFNITYTFLVNNRTDEPMSNVLVVDNLQNTFPQPTAFTKVSLSSTGGLVTNNGFNGMSDINLLSGTSSLAAFAIDTIRLTINLQPKGYTGTVNNVAVITATTPYGVINMNSSSQSFANETSKTPTTSVIPDLTIDIPEAFSPNRDGVNDRFVILKPFGTTLELEVFNRWGNVVYANGNYNNEWDGRGTNNFIGQDLMDGGYYYTLKAKSANGNIQIFKGFVLIQR